MHGGHICSTTVGTRLRLGTDWVAGLNAPAERPVMAKLGQGEFPPRQPKGPWGIPNWMDDFIKMRGRHTIAYVLKSMIYIGSECIVRDFSRIVGREN